MGNRYAYTEEFRREAVELARSSDRPRYKIAESLGVSDGALALWVKEAERHEQPGAMSEPSWRGFRKQLAEVTEEREICRPDHVRARPGWRAHPPQVAPRCQHGPGR
jgi:transposase